jgi:poly(ADP-ribose) glycohydrolase ARH3
VGQDGAALIAVAVHTLIQTPSAGSVDVERVVDVCLAHLETDDMRRVVAQVPGLLDVADPVAVAAVTGNGIAAHEAAPAALCAALHHPGDAVAAIRFAVRMGGDTDTVAAMAGSIVGAATGARALPSDLLARLEDRVGIEQVADALAARTWPHAAAGGAA